MCIRKHWERITFQGLQPWGWGISSSMMLVWLGGKEGNTECLDAKNTEQESASEGWLALVGFVEG